jgi:hypothetical protein
VQLTTLASKTFFVATMSASFTPHSESGRSAPQSQQSLTFKAPAGSTASFDLRKTLGTSLPSAGVAAVPAATVVATAAAPAPMFSPSAAAAVPKTDFLNAFGSIGLSAVLDCLPPAVAAQQQQQQQQPVVSSARALLEAKRARREAEAAAEAALPPRSSIAAAGSSSSGSAKQSGAMSYQAALGQKDLEALQQDEHHLKGMSKTKANASSKQKRRGRDGCKKGEQYEERKAGKVSKKETRTNRMAVLKHMY